MSFRPAIWLRNTIRNRLKASFLGRFLQRLGARPAAGHLHIVSATRMAEAEFWKTSALGRSLKIWRSNPLVRTHIQFENKAGLPSVYNAALRTAQPGDTLVFVHDDIWLDDPQWMDKLAVALRRFDVVGVAGNRRRSKNQPAWLFHKREAGKFVWDNPWLSGAMGHGRHSRGHASVYGPTPTRCELLDGAFIAARADFLLHSQVVFDELFDFHFYDMDFCRSARQAGLSLGTWPIGLTHQSSGAFGGPGWEAGFVRYQGKWKS